jgi:heat shock protein HslJ
VLLDAAGTTVARLAAQATALAGTAWQVVALNNGRQAVVGIAGGSGATPVRPMVEFAADGRISGFGGCNRFNGSWREPARGTVEIDALASTRRTCADDALGEQEARLLAALQSARTARREADALELRQADGALAVQLVLAKP